MTKVKISHMKKKEIVLYNKNDNTNKTCFYVYYGKKT